MRVRPPLVAIAIALAVPLPGGGADARAQAVPQPPKAVPAAARVPILKAARAALDRGDGKSALQHLLNALWQDPAAADATAMLLESEAIDADVRAAALLHAASLGADAKGAFTLSRQAQERNAAAHAAAQRIEPLRAAAAQEAVALAKKASAGREIGAPVIQRAARELFLDLASRAPAQWAAAKAVLPDVVVPKKDAHVPILTGLTRLAVESLASKAIEPAILAARSLHGLCAQADLPDLKGPVPPDLSKKRAEAWGLMERARALVLDAAKPWSIEELEAMGEDDVLRFTLDHDSIDRPAVGISPTGLYRVETICGHETLLHALRTVELHHRRLVSWFGSDPFAGRQGIVRIVPESPDLEAEGVNYWWAGGFQSGDVTVLRFHASSPVSLGGGLTHELTHRFDGALFGGLPGWLAEGRAVWTADSFANPEDASFVKEKAGFGTIEAAMIKGYGGQEKLEDLIEGTIKDYRDNYVAGYALFVYLATWEEVQGKPLYASRLRSYLESVGGARKRLLDHFAQTFADGKDGRPKDMKEFAARFDTFLAGFYWRDRKPFTQRYRADLARRDEALVFDVPTWQFSRVRAEPWFGQEQAAQAGLLLSRFKHPTEAAHAFSYGFVVDEFRGDRALALADLLDQAKEQVPAWTLRNLAHRRDPDRVAMPPRGPLAGQLPRTVALVDALASSASALAAAGLPRAAAALAADAKRIGAHAGVAPEVTVETPADLPVPFTDLPHALGWAGLVEDELTDYEEHRVPDLWFATEDADVHVGRTAESEATGNLDRSAHLHHAFVRGREWLAPGRWRAKCRIHFTTSYVEGAVVFGFTRRDRNLRLGFVAGDFLYSIGDKADWGKMDKVAVRLASMRDGEGSLAGRVPATDVVFEVPKDSFDFELLVDGPLALVWIDGKLIGSYSTPDSQPIEGHLGFATSRGAFRVERPTVSVEHRRRDAGVADPTTQGLTLAAGGSVLHGELLNRKVSGIEKNELGTVVLWMPLPEHHDEMVKAGLDKYPFDREINVAKSLLRQSALACWRAGHDPAMTLVLPSFFRKEDVAAVAAEIAKDPPIRCEIRIHEKTLPLVRTDREDLTNFPPMLLYVDPTGLLRAIAPFEWMDKTLPAELASWMQLEKARNPPPAEPVEPDGGGDAGEPEGQGG